MGKTIVSALFEHWKIDRNLSNGSKEEKEEVLTGSFLTICTINILSIHINDTNLLQKFFKAMLISVETTNLQCHDYQFVVKTFQDKR